MNSTGFSLDLLIGGLLVTFFGLLATTGAAVVVFGAYQIFRLIVIAA